MSGTWPAKNRWMVARTIGVAIGIPLGLVLGAPLEVLVGAMVVTPLMLGLCGLLLGTSQWSALRGGLPRAGRSVGLTTAGFAVGFTIAIVLVEEGGRFLTGSPARMATASLLGLTVAMVVIGVIGGGLVGFAQSFALENRGRARVRWTAASVLGLTAGFLSGLVGATLVGGLTTPPGLVVFLGLSGLVYSVVTGRALNTIGVAPPAGI